RRATAVHRGRRDHRAGVVAGRPQGDRRAGADTILFAPSNTAPDLSNQLGNGLYFRTSPSNVLQAPVISKLIADDGNGTAMLLSVSDVYGNSLRDLIETQLTQRHVRVV